MLKLNVGCGWDVKQGYVNLDYAPKTPDVFYYNLENPLPYKDGEVDEIYCSHVLEDFLYEFPSILTDFARVLKKGGLLYIKVPYGVNIDSVHHKRFFNEQTFKSLIHENFEYEDKGLFSDVSVKVKRQGLFTQFFMFLYSLYPARKQAVIYKKYLSNPKQINFLHKLDLKIGKKIEIDVKLIK